MANTVMSPNHVFRLKMTAAPPQLAVEMSVKRAATPTHA